jgi:uncharacterized coiled-coil DUF342 family protein
MDMKSICRNQVEEAKKYKWIMGQQLGYDPGNKAIEEWVIKYAKQYRDEHNECFNSLISKVFNKIKVCIKNKHPNLSDNDIMELERLIIEEFTMAWTKECAINEGDVHLTEI